MFGEVGRIAARNSNTKKVGGAYPTYKKTSRKDHALREVLDDPALGH